MKKEPEPSKAVMYLLRAKKQKRYIMPEYAAYYQNKREQFIADMFFVSVATAVLAFYVIAYFQVVNRI